MHLHLPQLASVSHPHRLGVVNRLGSCRGSAAPARDETDARLHRPRSAPNHMSQPIPTLAFSVFVSCSHASTSREAVGDQTGNLLGILRHCGFRICQPSVTWSLGHLVTLSVIDTCPSLPLQAPLCPLLPCAGHSFFKRNKDKVALGVYPSLTWTGPDGQNDADMTNRSGFDGAAGRGVAGAADGASSRGSSAAPLPLRPCAL